MVEARVVFKVPELRALRGEAGRFTSAGLTDQYARNRRMAETLRADVGRRMENHIRFGPRSGVSTGRLVRVTSDSRNSVFDAWRVGVGVESFLDASVAKYWRTFEEGSAAVWRHPFVGTQLRGRFGGSIVGWAPTRTPGPQPQPLAGKPWGARGGKLYWDWGAPLNPNFRVTREIAPAHVYRQVFRESHLDQYGLQVARRFLDRVFREGLTPPVPPPFFYNRS